jgi:hypothetical protein
MESDTPRCQTCGKPLRTGPRPGDIAPCKACLDTAFDVLFAAVMQSGHNAKDVMQSEPEAETAHASEGES